MKVLFPIIEHNSETTSNQFCIEQTTCLQLSVHTKYYIHEWCIWGTLSGYVTNSLFLLLLLLGIVLLTGGSSILRERLMVVSRGLVWSLVGERRRVEERVSLRRIHGRRMHDWLCWVAAIIRVLSRVHRIATHI